MAVPFLPSVFAVCARFAYSKLVLNKLCLNVYSCVKTIILDRESSKTFRLFKKLCVYRTVAQLFNFHVRSRAGVSKARGG